MNNRSEVREFLTTRRARLVPEQVGLPPTRSRRVPGLRRSEVASLAGLSVEYYARLERGQIAGASSSVLEALARALHLDDTERAHLSTSPAPPTESPAPAGPDAAPPPRPLHARVCDGPWRRSPTRSRSCATRSRTCSPPTPSAAPSTHR